MIVRSKNGKLQLQRLNDMEIAAIEAFLNEYGQAQQAAADSLSKVPKAGVDQNAIAGMILWHEHYSAACKQMLAMLQKAKEGKERAEQKRRGEAG